MTQQTIDPWRVCVDALRERWVGEEFPETVVGWMFDALDAAGDTTVPRDDNAREEARIMASMVFADIGPECDYGAVVSNVIRACEATAKTGDGS